MATILVTWIGITDLRAAGGDPDAGLGPIAQGAGGFDFDEVHLLSDFDPARTESFRVWLAQRATREVTFHPVTLTSPTAFGEIHEAVVGVLDKILDRPAPLPSLTFLPIPVTPAKAAIMEPRMETSGLSRAVNNRVDISPVFVLQRVLNPGDGRTAKIDGISSGYMRRVTKRNPTRPPNLFIETGAR